MRKLSLFLAFALALTFACGALAQPTNDGKILLDNTTFEVSDSQLRAGSTHLVSIRYDLTNTSAQAGQFWTGSNGFKVYSPDGADWVYLQGSTGPLVDLAASRPDTHFKTFKKHNESVSWEFGPWVWTAFSGFEPAGGSTGALSGVGFSLAALSIPDPPLVGPSGYADGDNDIAVILEFQTRLADKTLTMCVDTSFGVVSWEWNSVGNLTDYPQWDNGLGVSGPRCWDIYEVPNKEPVWCGFEDYPTSGPPPVGNAVPFNHCGEGSYQLCASDPDDPPTGDLTYRLVAPYDDGNYGSVDPSTGLWTWSGATVPQAGNQDIEFQVNDSQDDALANFLLHVTFTNTAPTIQCPGGVLTVSAGTTKSQTVDAGDVDVCDNITVTVVDLSGDFDINNTAVVDNGDGTFDIEYTPDPAARLVTMDVQVDDGDQQATCRLQWNVIEGAPYAIELEKVADQLQGHFTDVFIKLHKTDFTQGIGGFDLVVAYDASALVFQLASEGDIYDDCGWEYFTYRFGANGNCGGACPSGLLSVTGLAETNDGPYHPGCDVPDVGYVQQDQLPIILANLRFLVSDDRTLECQYVPIRFFWTACSDNVISNHDGSAAFLSQGVFDFFEYGDPFVGNQINGEAAYPTFQGAQEECLLEEGEKVAKRNVDFQNGGIDIICGIDIDDRGDINLNGLVNEIADVVMFTNYFISGLSAFMGHVEGSIAASDVNADGITLSVADLVYLIRVVIGDAPAYPKIAPVAATLRVGNDLLSINAEMGAAFIVMEGSVKPVLTPGAEHMDLRYDVVNGNTNILVYSTEAGESFSGNFLEVSGNLISSEFATYEGAPVAAKVLPTEFKVDQNYPNPFNPTTKIHFTFPDVGAWELGIYNITGQLVQSFSGNSQTGDVTVVWEASDLSSGIYFYKVSTGEQSMTKKAVLLK